jgi:hypothetical protein
VVVRPSALPSPTGISEITKCCSAAFLETIRGELRIIGMLNGPNVSDAVFSVDEVAVEEQERVRANVTPRSVGAMHGKMVKPKRADLVCWAHYSPNASSS